MLSCSPFTINIPLISFNLMTVPNNIEIKYYIENPISIKKKFMFI